MPFLLRKVRGSRWFKDPSRTWLGPDEPPADVFVDLKAEQCKMSVYRIDDGQANLDVVVAGLAANADQPDHLDYLLVDEAALDQLGIKKATTPGETPSALTNASHVDLEELSALSLLEVARTMFRTGGPLRKSKKEVTKLVRTAVDEGAVDPHRWPSPTCPGC